MVRHIVMWKIDKVPADRAADTAGDLREMLLRLRDGIDSVLRAEVGLQYEYPPLMVLCMDFQNWEGLEEYRVHPDHLAAVKVLRKHTTKLGAVDYEPTGGSELKS